MAVKIDMDIYPHERRLEVRGHYRMINRTSAPISNLHMRLPLDMELLEVKFPQHTVVSDDRVHGYTIYRLQQPLAPGAAMDFDFTLRYLSRGFRNTPDDIHVVDNGTFMDSGSFPHFGYSEDGQLEDRNERCKYGLGPVPRMPKIDDEGARRNHLLGVDSDWVTFETTVSTVTDQIALAPGYLEKEWVANGRRYFHYRMDTPITAHEVAHQWWAHQVIGAYLQGVTMLDETFAQYSALMVQEQEYGPAQMRKFLEYELDRYLSERSGELVEEMPLALVENQQYIHYRKGSVVMYSLKDYLGEDLVDRTLARFDRDNAFKPPPYTTTREFLADLRQEAGPKWSPLIEDLFEKITVFDNRMIRAAAKRRPDGKYDVTLQVQARKIHVDGVGGETPPGLPIR